MHAYIHIYIYIYLFFFSFSAGQTSEAINLFNATDLFERTYRQTDRWTDRQTDIHYTFW